MKLLDLFMVCGLSEFEGITFFKILLASLCGGIIGLEREMKGRPAGLKTFSLVCVGAALTMITNEYINVLHGSGDNARMAAQVISGIGFLGAGTIMVTGHNQIKGLTTAATLWVTAALGIAIGAGFYFGGIVGVVVIYITSFIYHHLDKIIMKSSRHMRIYVEGINEEFMLGLVNYFNKSGIKVLGLQRKSEDKWYEKDTSATIELDLGKNMLHSAVIDHIRTLEGLRYIDEL